MILDLDALEAAASAATPGPWYGDAKQGLVFVYESHQRSGGLIGSVMTVPRFVSREMRGADANFAVAANPAVVLQLVRQLREARERAGAAERFAGLVLREHRNDGEPGDVDGATLEQFAVDAGLLVKREITLSCGDGCNCLSGGFDPAECLTLTPAGRAAIAAAAAISPDPNDELDDVLPLARKPLPLDLNDGHSFKVTISEDLPLASRKPLPLNLPTSLELSAQPLIDHADAVSLQAVRETLPPGLDIVRVEPPKKGSRVEPMPPYEQLPDSDGGSHD